MAQTDEVVEVMSRLVNSLSPIAETVMHEYTLHDPWWVAWREKAQEALKDARAITGQRSAYV